MRYTVKFTTSAGEILMRDYDGASISEIRERVLAEGHFPMDVRRSGAAFRRQRAIGAASLLLFNQELLALLKAGIPLLQSLELLVGHGKDPLLRNSLDRVVELLKEGMSFSEALEQVGTFPPVYRANVVAGERSGTLPDVLARWLAFQNFAQNSRRRIIEALIYPMFLVLVMIIALAVIFNVVLPRFAEIYAGQRHRDARRHRCSWAMGAFVRRTLYFQAAGLVVLVVFLRWMFTTEAGKRIWEQLCWCSPSWAPCTACTTPPSSPAPWACCWPAACRCSRPWR